MCVRACVRSVSHVKVTVWRFLGTDRQLKPPGPGLGGGPGASSSLQGGRSSRRGNAPRAPIEREAASAPPGVGGAFPENDYQPPVT